MGTINLGKILRTFTAFFLILILTSNVWSKTNSPNYSYYGNKPASEFTLDKIAELYELIVSDADRAEKEIDILKRKVEKLDNPDLMIDVLLLEANMYWSKGDFVHMKLSYYQGLSWQNTKTPIFYRLYLKYFAALNEEVKGNSKKGVNLLKWVLEKAKKRKFLFLEGACHKALGKKFAVTYHCSWAKEHYTQAKAIFQDLGFELMTFDLQISLGISAFRDKDYQTSLNNFHQAKRFANQKKIPKCQANALISLAEAHLFMPSSPDSVSYYLDLFTKFQKDADIRDLLNFYWTKEHYFIKLGNSDSAYYYLNLQLELDEKIRSKMNHATAKEIDLVFKKLQNERKLRAERNTQKNFKLFFGFVGLVLLGSLFVLWLIIKEKSRYNYVLMAQKDDILYKKNQIDQALKEKELLLKEIHHRVKNNLQIISSLLSLQSKNMTDEAAKQAILEGKERIQAIALIHQKLYLDDNFARIDMQEYLGDLIAQLGKSYNDKHQFINLSLKTNGIIFNIDTVVPLGLIISELTTNAFKYAFGDKKEGSLKIVIQSLGKNEYELLVKDNGVGMLQDFDFLNSQTLGMEIVTALTDQLDGEITYKSGETGTSIRIKFKEINNN